MGLPNQNLFIVFEGIDGSGTSTQSDLLTEWFEDQEIPCFFSYQPQSYSPIGSLIREILRCPEILNLDDEEQFNQCLSYLFTADRFHHLHNREGILQHLTKRNFILDRYVLSTLAYNTPTEHLKRLAITLNEGFPQPDLLIYLDIPAEEAMCRLSNRGEKDVFEKTEILRQARLNYLSLLEDYQGYYLMIDGMKPITEIHEIIVEWTENNLNRKRREYYAIGV